MTHIDPAAPDVVLLAKAILLLEDTGLALKDWSDHLDNDHAVLERYSIGEIIVAGEACKALVTAKQALLAAFTRTQPDLADIVTRGLDGDTDALKQVTVAGLMLRAELVAATSKPAPDDASEA